MATTTVLRTKRPTPLSTHSLAAFMTWKQFDILLVLREEGAATTRFLSDDLSDIKDYDIRHGGAFYSGVAPESVYSSMRTLEARQLASRHIAQNGLIEWTITNRGRQALDWLEHQL
jgi:hypothetical protein